MLLQCALIYAYLIFHLSKADDVGKNDSVNYYSPSPYNLERACDNKKEEESFYIEPWRAAIFQVGKLSEVEGYPLSRRIHECKITIRTAKNFWLVAAIEHMKIRGTRDSSNKWQCSDYVQFSSPGRNILTRVLSVFDIDFSPKKSERLCGDKSLDGSQLNTIFDVSTDANSFSTSNNVMDIFFHQAKDERHMLNNSFQIVVTTFRHASEQVECEGKQKCHGRDIFCIDKNFICDGHVNCAFPGSGTDEKLCKVTNKRPKIFDTTSVIIIILTSIVSFGILICIISSIKNRISSEQNNARSTRRNHQQSNMVASPYYPNAPPHHIETEAPLPPYESVILSDLEEANKEAMQALQLDHECETPPNYESLFPEESSMVVPPDGGTTSPSAPTPSSNGSINNTLPPTG